MGRTGVVAEEEEGRTDKTKVETGIGVSGPAIGRKT